MTQSILLLRDSSGNPKRFAVRCRFEDKERVKKAGSGTARWSKTDKVWTVPPDPVILKRLMGIFPDAVLSTELLDYIDSLYAKQKEIYLSTDISEPISPDSRLFPYQNSSVRVLDSAGSLILGHNMGLGKTPIVCAALDYIGAKKVIIVCPSSVKWSWVDHLIEWAHREDLYVVESSKTKTDKAKVIQAKRDETLIKLLTEQDSLVLLMSYEMLRIHQKTLAEFDFDVIVFDEAHRLKNRKALATQAAFVVGNQCARKWLLTGTPIRNQYTDIFTLLSLIDPVRFSSYWNFVNTYLETVPNLFGGTDIIGLKNEEEFNSMLSVYMYKLTKEEVLPDLPAKIYTDMNIPMNPKQLEIYQEMENEMIVYFQQEIESGQAVSTLVSAPTTVAQIIRLRQICLSPRLIGGPEDSAKLDLLYDLLKDLMSAEERVIIFSYFREFIKLVASMLDHIAVPYGEIVGGQKSAERYAVQQALTAGEIPIVIGTAQSMGEGMNLQAASTAIFCDIDWVPANNEQAEDRIHRGAIKTSPNIIRLKHPNSIETDIWGTCRRKEEIKDNAIGSVETIRNMILRREL
jgi:SWI/SNF-related matrix-associated actin-dependent regulator of chromatin subfamily A-like protein 1